MTTDLYLRSEDGPEPRGVKRGSSTTREATCPLAHLNLGFLQWKPGKGSGEEDGLSQGNLATAPAITWSRMELPLKVSYTVLIKKW